MKSFAKINFTGMNRDDWNALIGAVIFAIALTLASAAYAMPCWVVKKAVSQYGEAAAESWARNQGYTGKQIEELRKCLRR